MRADVLGKAFDAAASSADPKWPVVYMSPRGRKFDQAEAKRWQQAGGVTILCGRFEGVDERVLEAREVEEISVGDFVLSGGEPAALVMLDAVVRMLPGIMGAEATLNEESFESGLLEYPHYTRPQVWEGKEIPAVLTSGHHGKVAEWRRERAEEITRIRRPDLWSTYVRDKQKKV